MAKKTDKIAQIPDKKPKKLLLILLLISTFILVTFVITAGYFFYFKGWEDKASLYVAKVVPYPALVINAHPISLADYRMRGVDFTKNFYVETKGKDYLDSEEGRSKFQQKKRELLDILIEEEFVKEYSKNNKYSIEGPELNDSYEKLVVENGGTAAFEKSLREDYQWSTNYFREILRTNLLRAKIENSLCVLDSEEAKLKANDIKSQISSNSTFDELASKLSDDPATASSGGKLPPFSSDGLTEDGQMMDKSIVDFANARSKGDVEVIKTCQGYSVARLDDKTDDKRTVSHILVKIRSYDDLLSEFRDKSHILILLQEFYYSKDEKAVFPRDNA